MGLLIGIRPRSEGERKRMLHSLIKIQKEFTGLPYFMVIGICSICESRGGDDVGMTATGLLSSSLGIFYHAGYMNCMDLSATQLYSSARHSLFICPDFQSCSPILHNPAPLYWNPGVIKTPSKEAKRQNAFKFPVQSMLFQSWIWCHESGGPDSAQMLKLKTPSARWPFLTWVRLQF